MKAAETQRGKLIDIFVQAAPTTVERDKMMGPARE